MQLQTKLNFSSNWICILRFGCSLIPKIRFFLPSTPSPSYQIHVKIHRWNCSSFDSASWPIELIVIGKTKITFKWHYKMENCRLICAAMPMMRIVSARVWKIPPHSILNYSKVTAKFEGEKKKKEKHMTLHSSNSHLEVYRRLLALSVNLYNNWRNHSLGMERWTRTRAYSSIVTMWN